MKEKDSNPDQKSQKNLKKKTNQKNQKELVEETLRRKAEDILKQQPELMRKLSAEGIEKDIEELIHELGVHQIELEMQNADLRQKQEELEISRDKYKDLYDFAPISYFTIDYNTGLIADANLTATELLGIDREKLINKPFHKLIVRGDQNICYMHIQDVMGTQVDQTCELNMKKGTGRNSALSLKA